MWDGPPPCASHGPGARVRKALASHELGHLGYRCPGQPQTFSQPCWLAAGKGGSGARMGDAVLTGAFFSSR